MNLFLARPHCVLPCLVSFRTVMNQSNIIKRFFLSFPYYCEKCNHLFEPLDKNICIGITWNSAKSETRRWEAGNRNAGTSYLQEKWRNDEKWNITDDRYNEHTHLPYSYLHSKRLMPPVLQSLETPAKPPKRYATMYFFVWLQYFQTIFQI